MTKRPLNKVFAIPVLEEIKDHTMRQNPWPIGKDIMLYHWTAKPYGKDSKHYNLAVIQVITVNKVTITRHADESISYHSPYIATLPRKLYQHEGFTTQEEMDAWFKKVITKKESTIERHIMHFKVVSPPF